MAAMFLQQPGSDEQITPCLKIFGVVARAFRASKKKVGPGVFGTVRAHPGFWIAVSGS
jgi:hypothetical protein